jgi:hypothetical protein
MPVWWNGRHAGLRNQFLRKCRFDSCHGHITKASLRRGFCILHNVSLVFKHDHLRLFHDQGHGYVRHPQWTSLRPFGSVNIQFSSTSAYADDLIPQKTLGGFNDAPITLALTAAEVDRIRDAHFQVIGFNLVNNQPVYTPGVMTGRIDYQIPTVTSGGGGLSEDDVNTLINNALLAHSGSGGSVPAVLLEDESRYYHFPSGEYLAIYRYVTKTDMVNGDEVSLAIGWANPLVANPSDGNVSFNVESGGATTQVVDSTASPALLSGVGKFSLYIEDVTTSGFHVYIDPQEAVPAGTVIEFWSTNNTANPV